MDFQNNAENLFAILESILKTHPDGMTEYQLLNLLSDEGVPAFEDRPAEDTLNLFRRHFLLFHCLYRLRDQLLLSESLWLEIHCLKIVLHSAADGKGETYLQEKDHLRAYYLDMTHFEETDRDDVEAMLFGFWQRYSATEQRDAALEVLGLNAEASQTVIKQRYRELALEHHPDRGGEAQTFSAIADAAQLLLRSGI
jgi:hypothetical protein